ncbi:zinc ribbon domain-containing protein [Microbulbifer halophilus]|uniref:TerB family tellurite resistance protein n=1 Tax=Microbulbifer halophilus TaxID=453963 RepID=A0ABW5E9Y2_9GAMM|nr:zinc ribbon domain-containing protein [Microbulbifer halophilus]MCW8125123.1 zinc ribbon domain-containing protein [Microbulbifer halophilus]
MIIFGTRGITTTPQRGDFHCPTCSDTQNYALKRVRRFFTLYFIPLIPLNKLGEYVECRSCKDTYKPRVLDYDPAENARALEAEYHRAVKRVMIHTLLADGVVDDDEVRTAADTYQKVAGRAIDEAELRREIQVVQAAGEDLGATLRGLQGSLNDEGKELALRAALLVAMADGEFQSEEQALVADIGANLGMTKAHIQGVISSLESSVT